MAKVLFIEDDPGWQDRLQLLLRYSGHNVQRAADINTAISILESKQKFDLIVLDLQLEGNLDDKDIFMWLITLISRSVTHKLDIPPIIIFTGANFTKKQIVQALNKFHAHVYGFFEKGDYERTEFLQTIQNTNSLSDSKPSPQRSFVNLFSYTLLMSLVAILMLGILFWAVNQIPDPNTQQAFIQVGGAIIVVIAIFVTALGQNSKLENILDGITKIWR
jgi:CheY-like chemotaxis protein